jgi:hypothetical protein
MGSAESLARPPQVLKFVVGFTHILTLALGLLGVLPFACWTSAMVAYGMAGEMVKLAETNALSECACGGQVGGWVGWQ